MFAEKTSMGFVNMETNVTLDMSNKFALTSIATSLLVKGDILENVVGFMSMESVNLHHSVNSNMKTKEIRLKLLIR